ncbi:unnamed protein product, partial [Allacma fusca]
EESDQHADEVRSPIELLFFICYNATYQAHSFLLLSVQFLPPVFRSTRA